MSPGDIHSQISRESESGKIKRALNDLEKKISNLKQQYQLYFNDALDTPPHGERRNVERLIRKYRKLSFKKYQHQYKFSGISSKFNSLREMWGKRVKKIEEGTDISSQRRKHSEDEGGTERKPHEKRSRAYEVKDTEQSDEQIKKLYRSYKGALNKCGKNGKSVSLSKFRKSIKKQTKRLKKKKKCNSVNYSVKIKDDSVKVAATTNDNDNEE